MISAGKEEQKSLLNFDIDIDNDLGCVIMDEAHYINDKDIYDEVEKWKSLIN